MPISSELALSSLKVPRLLSRRLANWSLSTNYEGTFRRTLDHACQARAGQVPDACLRHGELELVLDSVR